jgi:choline dehydrogenase-like flavoprotein
VWRTSDGGKSWEPLTSGLPQHDAHLTVLRDAFTTAGALAYPLNAFRVKGVGGTTLHWSALSVRLHESDFRSKSLEEKVQLLTVLAKTADAKDVEHLVVERRGPLRECGGRTR